MLSKLVVKLYSLLLEIALWVMLVVGFAAGFKLHGLLGGIFGLIIAAILGAVFLGGLLVLNDIRKRVTALEKRGQWLKGILTMVVKSWKAAFWCCFIVLLVSNVYWCLVVIDQAATNKYTEMELHSQKQTVSELGNLIVTGIESTSKKDVVFILRQANPDAFIVDDEERVIYQNISFYFKNDRLVSIGEPTSEKVP